MKRATVMAFVAMVVLIGGAAGAADSTFRDISLHYEAIRQALMSDSTAGVPDHALAIREAAAALDREFGTQRAGVSPERSNEARELLPVVEHRADDLAAARSLEDVRSAFAELTKPLVRWHAMVTGTRPVVAYCPMVKKPWLQPDEAIGNPYDSSMLRCGEVVSR